MVVPGLKEAGGQGVITWALGGWNQRGAMYRPDFDVLPPEVEQNLPILNNEFKGAGLRLGACARPGELVVPIDSGRDTTALINPDDPQQVATMWSRFNRMIERGFSVFYCDSFGASIGDVKAMRFYREKMGPNVETFVEHPVDAILPYSGAYMELTYDEKGHRYRLSWGLDDFWEIAQWLVPGVQAACVSRVNESQLPAGFERPYHYMMRHHLTPIVQDYLVRKEAAELKADCDEFLSDPSTWK